MARCTARHDKREGDDVPLDRELVIQVQRLTRAPATAATARRAIRRAHGSSTPSSSSASSLLRLQATAGNAAVTRLIQADRDPPRGVKAPPKGPPTRVTTNKASAPQASASTVPFPGAFVPGYEPVRFIGVPFMYTEKDRDALLDGLKNRIKQNRKNTADFLGAYVESTIDIWGRYVTSEMSSTALASGSGVATKFLRFIVSESIAVLTGGVVGRIAKPLVGKIAGEVLGVVSDKLTDFTGGLLSDSAEHELLAADMKKRQETLDKINASLASQTGKFVTAGVESLADDAVDRTKWLVKAPLSQLDLFRIPEEIPAVDKGLIRSVVAGVIAAKTHQHDADKPCDSVGLQCGIAETVPKGSVGELDDNVVKIGLNPVPSVLPVNYIRFFTASPVLAKELAGKAQLNMVPEMALRIEVNRGDAGIAAGEILADVGSGTTSDPGKEEHFASRYGQLDKQSGRDPTAEKAALLTRNPEAGLRIAGVGLAESLWLYELASGDRSHRQLAADIERRHLDEQKDRVSTMGEPAPQTPSATKLAELTHAVIEPVLFKGVEKLIADHLGGLVLPNVEPKGRRVAR